MPIPTLEERQKSYTLAHAHEVAKAAWEQMQAVFVTGKPPKGYKDLHQWSWDFFPETIFDTARDIDVCQWIWSQPEFEAVNQRITELAKINPREMIIEVFFPRNVPELFYCSFEMLLTEENISDGSFAFSFYPEVWRPYIDEEANKKIVEGDKRRV